MEIFLLIFISILMGLLIGCGLMLYRNDWVLDRRNYVLYKQDYPKEYDRLLPYDTMLWKFWIWDVEKFKEDK